MTHEPDDLDQARMWLLMCPKEHANRMAEMSKRAGRRAIQRGDMGSPLVPCESIMFAPHSPDDAPSAKLAHRDQIEESYHYGLLHGFLGTLIAVALVTGFLWLMVLG